MAPRIPDNNWPDQEKIHPNNRAPAFKIAWNKQNLKANLGLKLARLCMVMRLRLFMTMHSDLAVK